GSVAPHADRRALTREHLLDDGRCALDGAVFAGQEERADPERLPALEPQAETPGLAVEEAVRDLGQHPGAVARVVGGGRSAVRHAGQRLERKREDLVRALARRSRHESDPAGVLLPPGVEVRSATVSPARPVPLGHALSSPEGQKERPAPWGAGRGFIQCLHVYAARSLPWGKHAGLRFALTIGLRRTITWTPPKSMKPGQPIVLIIHSAA